jgi:hypothetical protein
MPTARSQSQRLTNISMNSMQCKYPDAVSCTSPPNNLQTIDPRKTLRPLNEAAQSPAHLTFDVVPLTGKWQPQRINQQAQR